MKLTEEKCEACQVGAPRVKPDEQEQFLKELDDWIVITETKEVRNIGDHDVSSSTEIDKLFKEYKFKNYSSALEFATKVANLAENENHHPLIALEWGKVRVWWWTHAIKGLHKNDFVCAAKTDQL